MVIDQQAKRYAVSFILLLSLAVAANLSVCSAELTSVNYQGILQKDGERFNGIADFKFVIAEGATTLWSHDGTSANGNEPAGSIALQVDNGIFSVRLGASPMVPLTADLLNLSSDPHLAVWVSTGPNGFEQLPGQSVTSTLFSLHSASADAAPDTFHVAGRLGVGTSAPIHKLHVAGDRMQLSTPGNFARYVTLRTDGGALDLTADGGDLFVQSNSNDTVIQPFGGRVGIGTSSPAQKLQVTGNICATGSIGPCSDARFKENIAAIPNSLSKIMKLRGVQFDWKEKPPSGYQFNSQRQMGCVAQEIKEVFPEVVFQGSDGYYSVDYGRLVPALVEAIKELDGLVKTKDAKIASIEARGEAHFRELQKQNKELEAKLSALETTVARLTVNEPKQ